ncbi:MAG: hypothetical protein JNM43_13500 [Planctomycetaceae bacterium]|nr:hypothetical protein [Planctomycetaceae bacterium]
MISDDDLDDLIHDTASRRNDYFATLGQLDGNWSPIVNPRFADGPAWPTRPGWQRITNGRTTMIASSGLTDPWFESQASNNGIGVETIIATNDALPADLMQMTATWLYQFAVAISNAAATDGRFALRHDKYGIFLFGVPHSDYLDASDDWICYDDCFGFLIGIQIPQQEMTFPLPGGDARLLTAKLLTPDEYIFVADNGPNGAAKLNALFVADGSHHLSSIQRSSAL